MRLLTYLLLSFIISGLFAQEYDDLYFTKKDRKKQEEQAQLALENTNQQNTPPFELEADSYDEVTTSDLSGPTSFLGKSFAESNTYVEETGENGVSEEAIARYKRSNITESDELTDLDNPNFSNPNDYGYEDNAYYTDDQPVVVNNYYNYPNQNAFNNNRWRVGFGWNNWGGNFWSINYGGWYDPWYDPFFYNGWYDPWWGWGNPYAWNGRNRWNGWYGWNDPFYCPPGFYGNRWRRRGVYNRPVVIVADRGRSDGRRYINNSRRSTRGTTATRVTNSRAQRSSGQTSTRDYSRAQQTYAERARRSASSSTSRSSTSSSSSRSSSATSSSSGSSRSYNTSSSSTRTRSSSATTNRSSGSTSRSSGSSTRSYNSGSSSSRNSSGSYNSSRSSSGNRSSSARSSSSSSRSRSSFSSSGSRGSSGRSAGSSRSSSSRSSSSRGGRGRG